LAFVFAEGNQLSGHLSILSCGYFR
jgi:hypothetical protein